MANINSEDTVAVTLTAATAGRVTLDELQKFIDYLNLVGLQPTDECKAAFVAGNLLKLTAEVVPNNWQEYVETP